MVTDESESTGRFQALCRQLGRVHTEKSIRHKNRIGIANRVTILGDARDGEIIAGGASFAVQVPIPAPSENLALRHQLSILRRTAPRRVHLSNGDRLLFIWLYRLWPGMLDAIVLVRPETVVRWQRQGFRASGGGGPVVFAAGRRPRRMSGT